MLEQKVVSAILHLTALKEDKDTAATCEEPDQPKWSAEEASKIIMTGYQVTILYFLLVLLFVCSFVYVFAGG